MSGWRHWRLERPDGGPALLTLAVADRAANVLHREALDELEELAAELERAAPAGVLLRSAPGRAFCPGADVREFARLRDAAEAHALLRRGQELFARWQALPCPTAAVLRGYCLGGGLELALACTYRVAAADPGLKLGLPEVRLGIHPGYGGTVRLPRQVGDLAALRLMLTVNVPALVGLIVLADSIVALIFERGSFTAADTAATAAALRWYALGLTGYSAVRIAVHCFYALGSSRVPTAVSIGAVALNVGLNLALVRVMGYRGLALGASIAALANAVTLLALLRRRLRGLDLPRVLLVLARIAAASAAMGAAAWWLHGRLAAPWGGGFLPRPVPVAGAVAGGVLVLILAARLLRIRELDQALRQVASRLRRK